MAACPGPALPSAALLSLGATAGTAGDLIPVAALLVDGTGAPLAGRVVSFAIDGATLSATTDATGVARARWSATSVGALAVTARFAGDASAPAAQANATLTIAQARTVLELASGAILTTSGAAQVSAVLRAGSAWAPLAGRTVTFALGGQTASAVTDASGTARAALSGLQPGPGTLTAAFAGDSLDLPSSASEAATVGAASPFVIWGGDPAGLAVGQEVTFWGAQWAAQVQGGDYAGTPSFKGAAGGWAGVAICEPLAHTARAPLLDGACWSTKPGNSGPPATVPAYLGVTIATAIAKSGSDIYGNSAALGIVRVAPGYGPNPGHAGTGTLVAIVADGAGLFPGSALAVSQAQPATVLPGQSFAITATVTNAGAGAVTGVTVDEAVTGGASPGSGTLALGALAAGASRTGALVVSAPALPARAAAETSDAYLARVAAALSAPIVAAGTASAGAQALPAHASATSALQAPLLSVALAAPPTAGPGERLAWTATVTNLGTAAASAGSLVFTFPDGTTSAQAIPAVAAGGAITRAAAWTVPVIASRGATESEAAYHARLSELDGTPLVTRAAASWSDAAGNSYGAVERAATSVEIVPIVSLAVSGVPAVTLPGQGVPLAIAVRNDGCGDAAQASVHVTTPDGSTESAPPFGLKSGATNTVQLIARAPAVAPKGPGESDVDYLARLQLADTSSLTFAATSSWSDAAGDGYGPAGSAAQATLVVPIAGVTLAGPATATAGDVLQYTATLTALGHAPVAGLVLQATLPDGSTANVPVPSALLQPGASAQASFSFTTARTLPSGPVTATARVQWQDASGAGYGPLAGSATTQVKSASRPVIVLGLAGPPGAAPGSLVQYQLTATNTGTGPATSIAALVSLPDATRTSVQLGALAPGAAATALVPWTLPAVLPRAPTESIETYRARLQAVDGLPLTAVASATWTNEAGEQLGPAGASTTLVEHLPILLLSVKTAPGNVVPGDGSIGEAGGLLVLTAQNIGSADAPAVRAQVQTPELVQSDAPPVALPAGASADIPVRFFFAPIPQQLSSGGESSGYDQGLAALLAIDGTSFTLSFNADWSDPAANQYGPIDGTAVGTEVLPIVTDTVQAPATVEPGTRLVLSQTVQNVGHATARAVKSNLFNGLRGPSPATLLPGALATSQASLALDPPLQRDPAWSDESYLQTLSNLSGRPWSFESLTSWRDDSRVSYQPLDQVQAATTIEVLPIVTISGPATLGQLLPGSAFQLPIVATNAGTAPARQVWISAIDALEPGAALSAAPLALAVGASGTAQLQGRIPALAARATTETDATYVARLVEADNQAFSVVSSVLWNGLSPISYGPLETSASGTQVLPIVSATLTGPASARPGDAVQLAVSCTNTGHGAAQSGALAMALPDGTTQSIPPPCLGPGATGSATTSWSVPRIGARASQETDASYLARLRGADGARLAAQGSASWADAAGNGYGPVGIPAIEITQHLPIVVATLQSPPALLPGQGLTVPLANTGSADATSGQLTGASTIPFSLAVGQSRPITVPAFIPAPAPKGATETDAVYTSRLAAADQATVSAAAALDWQDGAANTYGPTSVALSALAVLPVVQVAVTAPAKAHPGETATDSIVLSNTGHAAATPAVTVTLPDGTTQTPAVAAIAPGASTTLAVSVAIPSSFAGAAIVTQVSVRWQDAAGNSYGPVSATGTTSVVRPLAVQAGPAQTIQFPASALLAGIVTSGDGPTSSTWTQVSGLGVVTFDDAHQPQTVAHFSAAGVYGLQLTGTDGLHTASDRVTISVDGQNQPPLVDAGPDQLATTPGLADDVPFTLTKISGSLKSPTSVGYSAKTGQMLVSVNANTFGQPYNFALVAADGTTTPFAAVSGAPDEVYFESSPGLGGFTEGDIFFGNGNGLIAKMSQDGTQVNLAWAGLPNEGYLRGGLHFDTTGVFGDKLVVTTERGGVWLVSADGSASNLAQTGQMLEGLTTIPNDPARYGPWAGTILAAMEHTGTILSINATGATKSYRLPAIPTPERMLVVPPESNFYAIEPGAYPNDPLAGLWGAPAASLARMTGDVLFINESPGAVWRVRWTGTDFATNKIAELTEIDGIAFAPVGAGPVAPAAPSATLFGSVVDDGLPLGGTLTSRWSAVSGPGRAFFDDATAPHTRASFSAPGTYVLQLTGNDGQLSASSAVTVTVDPVNQPPVVFAGADQGTLFPTKVTLGGRATDDGLPRGSSLVTTWSLVAGAGTATFADPHALGTSVVFSQPGEYQLQLTASDSELRSSDRLTVVASARGELALTPPEALAVLGGDHTLTASLRDADTKRPLQGVAIGFATSGVSSTTGAGVSGIDGSATFSYRSAAAGLDTVVATAPGVLTARATVHWTALPAGVFVGDLVMRDIFRSGSAEYRMGANHPLILGQVHTDAAKLTEIIPVIDFADAPAVRLINPLGAALGTLPIRRPGTLAEAGTYCYEKAITGNLYVGTAGVTTLLVHPPPFVLAVGGATLVSGPQQQSWPRTVVEERPVLAADQDQFDNLVALQFPSAGQYPFELDTYDCFHYFTTLSVVGSALPTIAPIVSLGLSAVDTTEQFTGYSHTVAATAVGVDGAGVPGEAVQLTISGQNAQTLSAVTDSAGVARFTYQSKASGDETMVASATILGHATVSNELAQRWDCCRPPEVSAGPDQVISFPQHELTLTAVGKSYGEQRLGYQWMKLSGPGGDVLSSWQASALLYFSNPGVYVYQVTASVLGAPGNVSSTVQVTVRDLPALYVDPGAPQTVTLAAGAALAGAVRDEAGLPVSTQWSLESGPGAVTFEDAQQLATRAHFSATGDYVLALAASDGQQFARSFVRMRVVEELYRPPRVTLTASAQTVTIPAGPIVLSATVVDALPGYEAGLTFRWWLDNPGIAVIATPNLETTTVQVGTAVGVYTFHFTVTDRVGSTTTDIVVNVLGPDGNQAPSVSAGSAQTIALPTSTVALAGSVSDTDGLPAGAPVTSRWTQDSGPAPVVFANAALPATTATFSYPGTYVLRLTASDTQLSASDTVGITVLAPPGGVPSVSILSPESGARVTRPTAIVGTVSGGAWKLEYALDGDDATTTQAWTLFAAGEGQVLASALGTLDATRLLNGTYAVRLSASSSEGDASAQVSVVVDKNLKVGNFSLSFTDLAVPLAGLPIQVIRTYDSRDGRIGDFGAGWSLSLKDVRLEKSGVLGKNWEETKEGIAFPTYCLKQLRPVIVTATFPTGKVYRFQATTAPSCQQLVPIETPSLTFEPMDGTVGTLVVDTNSSTVFVKLDNGIPGFVTLADETGAPYNPTRFQLTTGDGMTYFLDQKLGATGMQDRNGNTVSFSSDGIIHSSGKSIAFTRDGQGRITAITDPTGAAMEYLYDASGNLAAQTDREGNTTTYAYNETHGLLAITDPLGRTPIRNEYDASGRLLSTTDTFGKVIRYDHQLAVNTEVVTDRLGYKTTYEYDDDGNVVTLTDALGKVSRATYDSHDNKLTETNALGFTTTSTYDANDNKASETDALGNTTSWTYNGQRSVLDTTDARGGVTVNVYEANGNLVSTTDPLGNKTDFLPERGLVRVQTDARGATTGFDYDGDGHVVAQTDALNNVTKFTYDANGNQLTSSRTRTTPAGVVTDTTTYVYDKQNRRIATIAPDGSTTQTVYDASGHAAQTIDALGRITSFSYDDLGQLLSTTYPDGTRQATVYDANGRRLSSTDRAGRTTSFTYDALGRLTTTTFADGSTRSSGYDAAGRTINSADELGHVTTYGYDPASRRTSVTDALGETTAFVFDQNGNQATVTDAKNHTTSYVYDASNRQTQVVYADGTTEHTGYDATGNRISKADQAGVMTQYGYDLLGRFTSVTEAIGGITRYGYDEAGNRTSQTDANGHTTAFTYDALGRRASRTLPLGQVESFTYFPDGQLKTRTDFNGHTTTYAYDSASRLTSRTPDPFFPNEPPVTWSYTASGRRQTMTDATGLTTWSYDQRDRVLSKAMPEGTLNLTYDAAGNRQTLRSDAPDGVAVDYTWDALNRLASVTDRGPGGGATVYSYDAAGNLSGFTYPNGVTTAMTYDALNRLQSIGSAKGAQVLSNYTYQLGATGNRLSVAEVSGRSVTWTYDHLYRLSTETVAGDPNAINGSVTYALDPVGNRLSRSSTLPGVPTTTSTFDPDDRLGTDLYSAAGETVGSAGNAFAYDSEQRLVSKNAGAVQVVYDGDGNRVGEAVAGITTAYLVDDMSNPTGYSQAVEERVGGAVTRSRVFGLRLVSQRGLEGLRYYGWDGHSGIRSLSDPGGTVTDRYDYDAFGVVLNGSRATANDYLYRGEFVDGALGLQYLRARWLNIGEGRFVTRDNWEATMTAYVYSSAEPVAHLDPSGHFSLSEELLVVALIGLPITLNSDHGAVLNQATSTHPTGASGIDAKGRSVVGAFRIQPGLLGALSEIQASPSPTVQRVYRDILVAPGCVIVKFGGVSGARGQTYDNGRFPTLFECSLRPVTIDIDPTQASTSEYGWVLAHELSHAWDYFYDREGWDMDEDESCVTGDDISEADQLQNSHCRGNLLSGDLQTKGHEWRPRPK